MNLNSNLSIVVPTYNRCDFIDYFLEVHIKLARPFGIGIYISDNASTDRTKIVVEKWRNEYEHLYYHCNEKNLRSKNAEIALKLAPSSYVWMLGDTYRIPDGGLKYVLDVISVHEGMHDVFVVNLAGNITTPATKDYSDQNELLRDLGALMTCISCMVFRNDVVDRALFSRYIKTNFPQTGVIFEDIADRDFVIHWIQHLSVTGLEHPTLKKSNWSMSDEAFVIAEKWVDCIFSLPPSYSREAKFHCIKQFSRVSGFLNWISLINLRKNGVLTLLEFRRHKKSILLIASLKEINIFLICCMPIFIFKLLIYFRKQIWSHVR